MKQEGTETMNYEELYAGLQAQEKTIKDQLAQLQKLFKAIGKESEGGDLKNLQKDLESMGQAAAAVSAAVASMQQQAGEFDTQAYFENGDFAEQMLEACRENQVDVRGEFPVYEMFPYRVRLDTENQDIYLDRKKIQCMRPRSFAAMVKAGQERLNKASFNAQTFASELADAYDLACLKLNKRNGSDLYLLSLYKFLAPMSRFRKDYDQQSYAFDLARLYGSGLEETKNGRKLQFGPSRNQAKAIRILDKEGQEQYLATIRFFEEE